MKPNELMIGDWVMNACDTTRKVYELVQDQVTYELEGGGLNTTHCNQLYPIPLTENILANNGFALDKTLAEIGIRVYTRSCPAGDLSVKVFHDGSIRFGFIKLTYVHQLQHLLRMVDVQKEVEL